MFGMKRDLWLLFALNLAIGFSNQFVQPLFPLYLESLNASEMQIGLVLSLGNVVGMSLMIPGGMLMNRIGKKKTLLLSVAFASIPVVFIPAMGDWRTVVPFYIAFSASFSFFIVARMAMVAENATPGNRATLFGVMNLPWPIGGIVAPMLSGFIIENYGWGPIFYVTFLIMAASALPTLRIKEAPPVGVETGEPRERPSILEKRYLPFVSLIFMFHMLSGAVEGLMAAVMPLYLKNQILLPESVIGLFFTASSLLILFIQIPSGRLADTHGARKVLVLSMLSLPVIYGLWLFVDEWWVLLILYAASNGLRSMTWPSSLALLSDGVPPVLIGSAVGVRMTSLRLGSTIGPLLGGYLYSGVGNTTPFLACAVFSLLSVGVGLAFRENPSEERVTEESQQDPPD